MNEKTKQEADKLLRVIRAHADELPTHGERIAFFRYIQEAMRNYIMAYGSTNGKKKDP
jgi:hypothetical protein